MSLKFAEVAACSESCRRCQAGRLTLPVDVVIGWSNRVSLFALRATMLEPVLRESS